MSELSTAVNAVYGNEGIVDRILKALEEQGLDSGKITAEDLSSMDELHTMGREATIELGKLAGLKEGMNVLDIGSGIGGAARTLASEFNCKITGVDLTEEFCKAASILSEKVGLGDMVEFHKGNALDLSFEEERFDAAVMIHMNMNIADKKKLFSEVCRVLKPGSLFGMWEVSKGLNSTGIAFPVPWASDESVNFLVTPGEMGNLLEASGFELLHLENATDEVFRWAIKRKMIQDPNAPPQPGIDLVIENFHEKQINASLNFRERRIGLLRALARRPL